MHFVIASGFGLLGLLAVAVVAVGLPGVWILIVAAVAIELLDGLWKSGAEPATFGWTMIAAATGLAAIGEILEFVMGAAGAKVGGASRRGAGGAFAGGLIGAVAGIWIPIPVVGSLIGAVLGTFIGAVVGERSAPHRPAFSGTLKPATMATVGRVAGTVIKIPIAFAVWAALTVVAFL